MYTVSNIENEIIINKSRFIINIISVDSENDALNYLNNIRNKYKDATHNCYAYIIDNKKRFSDDGEPSSTAGMPILDTLEKNNLNHIICIVTRYFGGIKLGANGLIRAYRNCTNDTINKTIKKELINGYLISITFNYEIEKNVNKLIKEYEIINKTFDKDITYEIICDNKLINELKKLNLNLTIKKEVLIKK